MILNVKIKKFERLNIFFLSDIFPNDIFSSFKPNFDNNSIFTAIKQSQKRH